MQCIFHMKLKCQLKMFKQLNEICLFWSHATDFWYFMGDSRLRQTRKKAQQQFLLGCIQGFLNSLEKGLLLQTVHFKNGCFLPEFSLKYQILTLNWLFLILISYFSAVSFYHNINGKILLMGFLLVLLYATAQYFK